jgi:hypothetical protein
MNMRSILIFSALLFFYSVAHAQSPVIWGSGKAINLTDSYSYKSNSLQIITGSLDPSASAVNAGAGSLYISTNGSTYQKQDAGLTTNWLVFGAGGGGGGITAVNGQAGPTITIGAGTSGTDFAIAAAANAITLNLPTASGSNRGALSSADWTTFNNKEPSITATSSADYYRGDKTFQPLNKAAVGLANVDNTSDANKPVSTATQTALDLKADLASPTFTGTVGGITKAMVGLGNVDNTSDATKNAAAVTLTNKTVDADDNSISDIDNNEIKASAAIDATKIADGSVSSTEFQYIGTLSSNAQTQIDGKEPTITLLALNKGGTNKSITASAGQILYTDADSVEVLAAGTSGYILQSNGAAAPSWVASSLSLPEVCYIKEVQASGVSGSSIPGGAWTKRVVNTTEGDTSIVSLSSSVITLAAGTYEIDITVVNSQSSSDSTSNKQVSTRLRNTSDSTTALIGTSQQYRAGATNTVLTSVSRIAGRVTIAGSKNFEIQQFSVATATNGGHPAGSGENEIYLSGSITKLP